MPRTVSAEVMRLARSRRGSELTLSSTIAAIIERSHTLPASSPQSQCLSAARRSAQGLADAMTPERETGWLADLIYARGRFESGYAMFVDQTGRITRFSDSPEDLTASRKLPDRAILPGLINCHSHSFQRVIR